VRLAALIVLAAPAVAIAAPRPPIPVPPPSPPDPSAIEQASDANFDEDAPHHGFRIEGAVGPADQLAFGIEQSSGRGPGASLRLGAAATRNVALLFSIDFTSYLSQVANKPVELNSSVVLSLGPQIYVRDAIWLRFGFGFGSYQRRTDSSSAPEKLYAGPAGQVGAGYDVVRRDRFALSVQFTLLGAIYRDGFIGGGIFGVGIAYR
jgi:hypothetical protein